MLGTWLFQIVTLLFLLTACAFFLGEYMAKVFSGERTFISPILAPVENFLYKLFGIDPNEDMNWKTFAMNVIFFIFVGMIALFFLLRMQDSLPLNLNNFKAIRWDAAINAAISFVTNSDWQPYKSEAVMSYLTRMLGMGLQNFLSAATGMAVAVALINAFVRKNTPGIGNFWVYLTRSIIYVLLPLSIVLSLFLVSQGSIANLNPYVHIKTLEGKEQIIAQGPAAPQIAIKQLGTSGGGFFAANSAHPYENPTPITDYVNILALLLIAAAFPFAFGALIKDRSQGWAIFIAMMLLFIIGLWFVIWSELHGNPLLTKLGIHNGVNMEGKEVRFGPLASAFFANSATATSAGAASSSYDSLMPLTGIVLIFNMAIGEVIFGGVGSGFIGMMFYVMLTMFLIGLMIGRSPEVYGKKLEAYEMIMIVSALFLPCALQLILSAIAVSISAGTSSLGNPTFHGLSEVIYAYASGVGNNGSAFAGLKADTPFYNLTIAFAMLAGYLITIIPALAVAGSITQKNSSPLATRFPTNRPLFILVLVGIIFIIGALTFFPALVLGPVVEHLYILSGKTF
ncbi:MAG TPA: potassium-transporting ATPase subunit KdpA [Coxiellaceae bacterium]|nr:MAG: potassium-transporting ATPase subunit A [Gammaproteobacteria bacterium RBG_16_37_9]HBC71709.1 potassium-transporting ATPase subunit KdpA [Coxiellaceae bacterium]